MIKYIGIKEVVATPMCQGSFMRLMEKPFLEDEALNDGYMVQYKDGYRSWSPKDVFEESYKRSGELTFGAAIEVCKKGKRIARKGWNGANMYVYFVPSGEYKPVTKHAENEFGDKVPYRAYLALKTAQNDIATWAPSTSDVLAEDWVILEDVKVATTGSIKDMEEKFKAAWHKLATENVK